MCKYNTQLNNKAYPIMDTSAIPFPEDCHLYNLVGILSPSQRRFKFILIISTPVKFIVDKITL